jgi:hypothetical protein
MEQWENVPDFEGMYEVSSLGRIKRIATGCGTWIGRMLKPSDGGKGYLYVSLSKNDVTYRTGVSRLVAKVFIPNPDNLPEVNHRDGIKANNAVTNLEWTTHLDNIAHSCYTGLRPIGEDSPGAKLTAIQVAEIRSRYVKGNGKILAKEFGVTNTQICRIVKGICWNAASNNIGNQIADTGDSKTAS